MIQPQGNFAESYITVAHMDHRSCTYLYKTKKMMKRQRTAEVPPLAEELLAVDQGWVRRRHFILLGGIDIGWLPRPQQITPHSGAQWVALISCSGLWKSNLKIAHNVGRKICLRIWECLKGESPSCSGYDPDTFYTCVTFSKNESSLNSD